MIKFNTPYLSGKESSNIEEALESRNFSGGKKYTSLCENFLENEFGFRKCYLTPSCTAAIEMAALLLDLNENDEVIIPSYTFASCPNPFLICGAKIVLADCETLYPNVSVSHIQSLISKNTKAIMVMHYGGVACNMVDIKELCQKHNIFLIEDAAQCIGSSYKEKPLGSYGDISMFSFHETKNITCGEGGALAINNPNLIEKAEVIRQYGTNRTAFLEGKTNHYEWIGLGLALFQSEVNAAFLYSQLQDIEPVNDNRKFLWKHYYNLLKNLASKSTFELPSLSNYDEFNAHIFFITLSDENLTNKFIEHLRQNNIAAAKHFYPLHMSKNFPNSSSNKGYPNATKFCNTLVRLPLHHYLTKEDIEKIVTHIKSFFDKQ